MEKVYNAKLTADRVKMLAKERSISMSQLSKDCGINQNTIKTSGKSVYGMKAKNLFLIAEMLDCSVDYLLGRTDDIEVNKSISDNCESDNCESDDCEM